MPSTLVLYDELGDAAQTGGTWTQESIPSGATGPAAPGVYNDPVDFTGEPEGEYIYKYTKGGDSALVVVNWEGDTSARLNTTCPNAFYIPSENAPPYTYRVYDNSDYVCGDQTISTDQDTPLPTEWIHTPYSGDVWYEYTTGSKSQLYAITIQVDGSPYGDNGIFGPAIDIYTRDVGDPCASNTQVSSYAASPGQQTVTGALGINPSTTKIVSFRISSPDGLEGEYDIIINGICP